MGGFLKILAIDTTAAAASVALCEDEALRGEFFVNIRQTHSETLMPMAGSLLQNCGVSPAEIGLFAVSCGPGSFTGVRIGVAAVKGLALPFGTPCAAVSSLEALAENLRPVRGLVCSVMDARRGQFYNALFEAAGGTLRRLCPDRAVDASQLEKDLLPAVREAKNVFLVGDGTEICYNMLSPELAKGVLPAPPNVRFARASSVAAVGLRLLREGKTVSAEELLPYYLRLPQAERELGAKRARPAHDEPGGL